jgi:diketogulonate reductase-like aldo/keto reductase
LTRQLLDRREFGGLCAGLGSSLPAVSAMLAGLAGTSAFAATAGEDSNPAARTVKFRDGTVVPALGQGSWHLGLGRHPAAVEEEALRTGLSLGMTLVDTSEGYADGHSEELIGRAIAGQRDRVFLVSKVDHMADHGTILRACDGSLARLGTDHLDLYLAHWRDRSAELSALVTAFESLRTAGKIRAWGVSNFSVNDMEELFAIPNGDRCATNQVLYNLGNRAIEDDLLPWCEQHEMPVMAYTPLGGASLLHDATLERIAAAHGCTPAAVALAWAIRSGKVIAIPESGRAAHVKENAAALSLMLTPQELQTLDAAHPPPDLYHRVFRQLKQHVKSAAHRVGLY